MSAADFEQRFGTSEWDEWLKTKSTRHETATNIQVSVADINRNTQVEAHFSNVSAEGRTIVSFLVDGRRYAAQNVDKIGVSVSRSVWPAFTLLFYGDETISIHWTHPDIFQFKGMGPRATVRGEQVTSFPHGHPCERDIAP